MSAITEVVAAIFWRYPDVKSSSLVQESSTSLNPVLPEVLLAMRSQQRVFGGYWEFPGGKIETGESHHMALKREIHEELGVDIEHVDFLTVHEHHYSHAWVRLHFFLVSYWHGCFQLREHDGLIWQPLNAIRVTPLLPANHNLFKILIEYFQKK